MLDKFTLKELQTIDFAVDLVFFVMLLMILVRVVAIEIRNGSKK